MDREILVVSGGYADLDFLRCIIDEKERYIIGVDRGLEGLDTLGVKADLAVGDFDSAPQHIKNIYEKDHIIKLNREKDYTDTHVAKTGNGYSCGHYRRKTRSYACKHKSAIHLHKGKGAGVYVRYKK